MSVRIHDTQRNEPEGRTGFSGPEFWTTRRRSCIRPVIGRDSVDVLYRSREGTQRLSGSFRQPGTFEFLDMPAASRPVMQPADYEPDAPPVFVCAIKPGLESFGADPTILNTTRIEWQSANTSRHYGHRASGGRRRPVDPLEPSRTVAYAAGRDPFRIIGFAGRLKAGIS